jgi:hypothetical protein
MTAQAVLEATSIGLRYPGESRAVLETFDFTLEPERLSAFLVQAASANRACCACWMDAAEAHASVGGRGGITWRSNDTTLVKLQLMR